jgi:uncharacterized protein YjbI with pentapeptide repeats
MEIKHRKTRDIILLRTDGGTLEAADLSDANLAQADLSGWCLRRAMLRGADLRNAKLAGADVTGADLRDADLAGADLRGIRFDATTRWPSGFQPNADGDGTK